MKKLALFITFLLLTDSAIAIDYRIKYENNKCGITNIVGNFILEPIYDSCQESNIKKMLILNKDKETFLYNTDTRIKTTLPNYALNNILTKDYISMYQNDEFYNKALFTIDGKQLTDFKYFAIEKISEFAFIKDKKDQLFTVYDKDSKAGVIDINGREIVPIEYDRIFAYAYYIVVTKDNKEGLFDRSGNKLYDPIYKKIDVDMEEGYIRLYETGYRWKTHYISDNDKIAYAKIEDNDEPVMFVTNKNTPITEENLANGSVKIIEPTYQNIKKITLCANDKKYDFLFKKENGKYKLMDENFKTLSEEKFDLIDSIGSIYSKNYLKFHKGEECIVFDKNINAKLRLKANDINILPETNYFLVSTNNGYVPYNLAGKKIQDIVFEDYETPQKVPRFYQGFLIITLIDGKKGVLDNNGELIIPAIYNEISFEIPIITLKKDGKYAYYDLKKKFLSKCIYDKTEDSVNKKGYSQKIFYCNEKKVYP